MLCHDRAGVRCRFQPLQCLVVGVGRCDAWGGGRGPRREGRGQRSYAKGLEDNRNILAIRGAIRPWAEPNNFNGAHRQILSQPLDTAVHFTPGVPQAGLGDMVFMIVVPLISARLP